MDVDGTELLEFLADGYSPKLLRKLKRGQYVLGDEFDPFVEGMAFGRFLGERPPGKERFDPYKR